MVIHMDPYREISWKWSFVMGGDGKRKKERESKTKANNCKQRKSGHLRKSGVDRITVDDLTAQWKHLKVAIALCQN